jgi:hypothetical protein
MKKSGSKKSKDPNHFVSYVLFAAAMAAMVLIVFALDFLPRASFLQDGVFLIGDIILLIVAIENKQKNLIAIQTVILIGIVLSLFSNGIFMTTTVILSAIILLIGYLYSVHYYSKEPIGFIGSAGFVLLAIGYALNTGNTQILNSLAFGIGAILVAIYSLLSLLLYKVRVQIVWIILNVVFAIGPLAYLASL